MSQWTHVNASIRFDSIFSIGLPSKAKLGKMCKWEDEDDSHWEKSKLPCGNEGSILYRIIKIRDQGDGQIQSVIVFTGDLRAYDNVNEIITYFNMVVKGECVESGILEIKVEFKKIYTLRYNSQKESFEKVSILSWKKFR